MRSFLLILAAYCLLYDEAKATPLPTPTYPAVSYYNRDQGVVNVEVTFGADGKATECEIMNYTTSKGLAMVTRDFILRHWKSPQWAGNTVHVPIVYDLSKHSSPAE